MPQESRWGAGCQVRPFFIISWFYLLTTDYCRINKTCQEGVFPPSCHVSFYSNVTGRGHTPSCHFFFTRTRREGSYPFPLCFSPFQRDRRGRTPSRRVSFYSNVTGRGHTPSCRFFFTRTRREGVIPLPVAFPFTRMRQEG